MTWRQGALAAIVAGVVLVVGLALGYLLATRGDATATPTPSAGATCQVSVSPTTIRVDPDTGQSDDVLSFAGSGFPPNSAVTIDFFPQGAVRDYITTAGGDFTAEVSAAPGGTHPSPPDIEPGPQTWTVIGWDAPLAPGQGAASVPPRACEVEVVVTIELTHPPSGTPLPTPPLDLSAGGYAEVVAEGVRVRVQPSLDATVVGALFPGDVVRILAPAQVVEGIAWYRVESVVIQSGQPVRGYVAAGADGRVYLQPTTKPPPPTPTPQPSPTATPAPG